MSFEKHFQAHLNWIDRLTADVLRNAPGPGPEGDEFRSDLAGLLLTAYFAAFECCVKSVFVNFATSKHKLLATVIGFQFERINGKIQWQVIADQYARQFGENYRTSFMTRMKELEEEVMIADKVSVKNSFQNLMTWRHAFAHEGQKLASLEEVIETEKIARRVIFALDATMSARKVV